MTPVHPLLAIAERESRASATIERREANPHGEVHYGCDICSPDGSIALCGARTRGEWDPSDGLTCAVCADLAYRPCPRCGA